MIAQPIVRERMKVADCPEVMDEENRRRTNESELSRIDLYLPATISQKTGVQAAVRQRAIWRVILRGGFLRL